jgi:hypothetical protein
VFDAGGGGFVVLGLGHGQQLEGIACAAGRAVELAELVAQRDAFLAEGLGAFRVGPDLRVFQLADYFFETIAFAVVLKETPSRRRRAPRCLVANA